MMNEDEYAASLDEEQVNVAKRKFNTCRKKVCPNCSNMVGNACKICSNCGALIPKRKAEFKLPKFTSTTDTKRKLLKRALTLQQNHGYHVVVMYCHPSCSGGPTVWDFSATPGPATEFISNENSMGKTARNFFKLGMRKVLREMKEASAETSNSEDLQEPSNVGCESSCAEPTTANLAPTTSSNTVSPEFTVPSNVADQPLNSRSNTTNLSSSTVSHFLSTSSNETVNSDSNAGTLVQLTNDKGVVCAEGCLTGFSSVHNQPVPASFRSVVVTTVTEGISVAPPCPTSFDNNVVEEGGFYAWPVSQIRPK